MCRGARSRGERRSEIEVDPKCRVVETGEFLKILILKANPGSVKCALKILDLDLPTKSSIVDPGSGPG